jgi:hypothetical protein
VRLASNLETVAHKRDSSDKSTMHVGRFYSKPEMHARGQPEPAMQKVEYTFFLPVAHNILR